MSDADSLIIRLSIRQLAFVLVCSLAFVAAGVFVLIPAGNPSVAWLGIGFGGPGAGVALWLLFDRRPYLVLDDDGLYYRPLKTGKIPWSEVLGACVKSWHSQKFLCLELRDPERIFPRRSRLRRWTDSWVRASGLTEASVYLPILAVRSQQVEVAIRRRIMRMSCSNPRHVAQGPLAESESSWNFPRNSKASRSGRSTPPEPFRLPAS